MNKLMVISVSPDSNELVAASPISNIELARAWVSGPSTREHIVAAKALVTRALAALEAEGYPRAVE